MIRKHRQGPRYATVIGNMAENGALHFEWIGDKDALLRVSVECVDDGVVEQLPWHMERVSVDTVRGVALYRRAE